MYGGVCKALVCRVSGLVFEVIGSRRVVVEGFVGVLSWCWAFGVLVLFCGNVFGL